MKPPPGPLFLATAEAEAMDVPALTRRLVAGEEAAWTEMHRHYAPRLWRYLLVAARGDEEVAGECLQQTFIRAVRHIRRFDHAEALWSWLTLMARQVLSDGRRAAGRRRTFLQWFASHFSPPAGESRAHDPLPAVLETAWPDLSEEDRRLLERKYLDGESVRQLAEAAGTSEKTIESRLTRARRRLRGIMLHHLRS